MNFYKTGDFSAEYLSPFTSNNILFSVDPRLISGYVILLKLFTPPPGRSVFIHEAKIGANGQLTNAINAELSVTDEMRDRKLVVGVVQLFDVEKKLLDEIRHQDGALRLAVSYSIDGVFGVMNFTLVRRPRRRFGTFLWLWNRYEVIAYQHEPSERFYTYWDSSADYLSPFTANDIVFAAAVRNFEYAEGTYNIWNCSISLGLYSHSAGRPVFIHEAKIKGADRQLTKAINAEFHLTEKLWKNPEWGRTRIDLFNIREDELEEMMLDNDGKLTLEVSYTIDGVFSVMSCTLVRSIEKGLSWIT